MKHLSIEDLRSEIKNHTLLVDTRPTDLFVNGYLKGAINIVLNQNFEARTDFFSKSESQIVIVARKEDEEKITSISDRQLQDKIAGIHFGDFDTWKTNELPIDLIINVDAYELNLDIKHDDKAVVLDVRTQQQYDEEHIVSAVNMPMTDFNDHAKIGLLDDTTNFYLHCNGGTRSVLISSVLKRNGYHNIRNIEGGFKAVLAEGTIPTHSNNKKTQN